MTGISVKKRFKQHKDGYKAGKGWVRDCGVRILTECMGHLYDIDYEEALQMEERIGKALKEAGFWVEGGH